MSNSEPVVCVCESHTKEAQVCPGGLNRPAFTTVTGAENYPAVTDNDNRLRRGMANLVKTRGLVHPSGRPCLPPVCGPVDDTGISDDYAVLIAGERHSVEPQVPSAHTAPDIPACTGIGGLHNGPRIANAEERGRVDEVHTEESVTLRQRVLPLPGRLRAGCGEACRQDKYQSK